MKRRLFRAVVMEHIMPRRSIIVLLLMAAFWNASLAAEPAAPAEAKPKLVAVRAGEFRMGNLDGSANADLVWNELPAHTVRITSPFFISDAKVTLEEFRRFRPGFEGTPALVPAAAGVSWHDAMAYCDWLSKKEGRNYRLPTEAEWEYACRQARLLGLSDMGKGAREWCMDWYGPYADGLQTDPVGPAEGFARVVRGGALDVESNQCNPLDFAPASCRAGMPPGFGLTWDSNAPAEANQPRFGAHSIGFRVVEAPLPATPHMPREMLFSTLGVRQNLQNAARGPKAGKPYFRKREVLTVPPARAGLTRQDILAAGLDESFGPCIHSPALTACPNGDLLYMACVSFREYEPRASILATRLRQGTEEWDVPSPLLDMPGVNDHSPLLWNDGGEIRLFWGNPCLPGAYPFQWISSKDSGATWSEVKFPLLIGRVGKFNCQPVNSAFRGADGTMFISTGGEGSMLWASKDDGRTWFDTGGRTGAAGVTFCMRKDGGILGLGGRGGPAGGNGMPRYISRDGGISWQESSAPFSRLGEGQRPCLLRLASGRLFLVTDVQNSTDGSHPDIFKDRGACVAISGDDGESWTIKMLPGLGGEGATFQTSSATQAAATKAPDSKCTFPSVGEVVACQSPDGLIHVVTGVRGAVPLHFAMNEAWILAQTPANLPNEELMAMSASSIGAVREANEHYPDGSLRLAWSGGFADDGQFMPHGRQTWFYPNGKRMWDCDFILGCKIGTEIFWAGDATKAWQWEYRMDGTRVFTRYWPSGGKKLQVQWVGRTARGAALQWNEAGGELAGGDFANGVLINNFLAGRAASQPAIPLDPPVGLKCYMDRDYVIASVPPELHKGKLVRTISEGEYSAEKAFLGLELPEDSTVYVCFWAGAKELPDWLKEDGWAPIKGTVTVQQKTLCEFRVYARKFPKGKLTLGGNDRDNTQAEAMYFLVIQPEKKH